MVLMDIKHCFPSVRRPALERTIGPLPVHGATFGFLLDWLDELDEVSGIKGLPTGLDGSRVLAEGLLRPCDSFLARQGAPFLRYVDDTWCFVDLPSQYETVTGPYAHLLDDLDLELHPDKTTWLAGPAARNEIERLAIAYFEPALDEAGEGRQAGLALFEYALEDPARLKSELRRALRSLAAHRDLTALEVLRSAPQLLAVAPHHWVRYLSSLMADRKTRREVGDDWLIEQVVRPVGKDTSYTNLLYLQVASRVQLGKDLGRQVFEVAASSEGGWSAPLRVWAAHVWGQSDAFKPNAAIEQVEERGDYSTKRAFALSLDRKRSDRNLSKWARRIRLADPELEPTASWLEAA